MCRLPRVPAHFVFKGDGQADPTRLPRQLERDPYEQRLGLCHAREGRICAGFRDRLVGIYDTGANALILLGMVEIRHTPPLIFSTCLAMSYFSTSVCV